MLPPMTLRTPLWSNTASQLLAALQAGDVSAREVVLAHIERTRTTHERLNAVVLPRFDEALAEAVACDSARARGSASRALQGLPITIKDQHAVKGMPLTLGLTKRKDAVSPVDGPLVARLKAAGAIVIGKTNVSQLLLYHEADNPVFGRTNHPQSRERTPGGSSGGESAILAAGGSPLGLGGDLGGSVRVPAHFTGICGLKPTAWRLTNLDAPVQDFPLQEAIWPQPGPLARSTADLALAMRVLCQPGLERLDCTVMPVPWVEPNLAKPLRAGYFNSAPFFPAAPAVARAVDDAAQALAGAGWEVVPLVAPDMAEVTGLFLALLAADGGRGVRPALQDGEVVSRQLQVLLRATGIPNWVREVLVPLLRAIGQHHLGHVVDATRARSAHDYFALLGARAAIRQWWFDQLDAERIDVVLCPPHALPAMRHGATEWATAAACYAFFANLLGLPGGVVPVTTVRADEANPRAFGRDRVLQEAAATEAGSVGLPVGVQILGRLFREDQVLATMQALEDALRDRPDWPLKLGPRVDGEG
jgi:fatty acid amide hydrolase